MQIAKPTTALARFLRILSVCYGIGFLLHVADLTNLRLRFSEMSPQWKVWTAYLLIADVIAAIGLWRQATWGIAAFLVISLSQLVAYLGFRSIFGDQTFLIFFHLVTLLIYFSMNLAPRLRARRRSASI